jgi:hypothetical protein
MRQGFCVLDPSTATIDDDHDGRPQKDSGVSSS